MKRSYAVIGLGLFGRSIALALADEGCHVVAADKDESRVREIADRVALAMVLDATDDRALRESGIKNVDVAVVSIGEDIEASVLAVMLLKESGVREIVAKAVTDLHEKVLMRLGVDRMVHPERDMAERVAQSLVRPDVLESIHLSPDYSVAEIEAPQFLWGTTLGQSSLRARYGLTVIAIRPAHAGGSGGASGLNINPHADTVINSNDALVVIGRSDEMDKLRQAK